ncbi:MAG: GNAT family N-acetyltransferase [Acidobacteria bacterium]|nr:GNAT family N-acetyltransferase [Acidobacteriota bacterium]
MQLRVMTQQDIRGGVRLNTLVGWNQTEADWERFLNASPNGSFVMEDGAKIVGTAATFRFENKFAWISMVLVDPDYRNQGIGTSLLRRAIEYLDDTGMPTLKLDATPAGKPLYEKLGFVTEYEIDRWILKRTATNESSQKAAGTTAEDLSEVFEFDREAFGADRGALLRSLNEHAPDLTLVARGRNKLTGYVFGRRGLFADHLGPWMARGVESARPQLAEFLQRSSRDTIIVDAFRSNPIAGDLLRENGFIPARLLTRMYRGPNTFPGQPDSLCAIMGPEFG